MTLSCVPYYMYHVIIYGPFSLVPDANNIYNIIYDLLLEFKVNEMLTQT